MSVRLVIIGPPGAGKSSVGTLLAHELHTTLRDTDTDVEEVAGKSIADIFIEDGEDHFRHLEHEAVLRALAEHDGILALGGGAVVHDGTRDALRQAPVVFLDVSMAKAMPRVGLSAPRPLLIGSPRARWKQLMDARRHRYEEVADLVIDTDDRSVEELAAKIAHSLSGGELHTHDGERP